MAESTPSIYKMLRKNGFPPATARTLAPFALFGLFVAEFGFSKTFGFATIWSYLFLTVE